ncbi:hypothetical protein RND81_03G166500 [Saponaria officinalis]|uniref:non-specific serine/threonine protein kinase n=1 Tax=Saponaria officinalis TaxID=3572 RepID=A0AAW1M8A9_SAPOF
MKPTHLKTHDNHSSLVSSICIKPAFLIFFLFVVQNITAAGALRRFDYETDHAALLAIKNQLVDRPEGVFSSWNDSVPHCAWAGVTCGRKHKRVTMLHLNSRNLSGTISPFIGNLSFLNTIALYNNSLHGQIPDKIGDLFRLQELWINNNTIDGEIPGSLSSCLNLRILSMSYNKLEGKLPAELRALSKLEILHVRSNNFTGPLFDIIQNLTSLVTVITDFNGFTGVIPNSIGRMQNLVNLGLASNKLSGTLPVSLFNISSLQILDVMMNQFHGEIPTHKNFNVSSLKSLNLAENNFSGSIPNLTNLTRLESIILDYNSFTGRVLNNFQRFHNLRTLVFSYNYLEGDINFVNTLTNCTQLKGLELVSNDFSGKLPQSISNLSTSLTFLTIGDSLITGVLPVGITNLINLQGLVMRKCKLTSSIPSDIGKLRKLQYLDLSSNKLTGKIPDSLGNLSFLSGLYLENNQLEAKIPPSMGKCQSLLYLNFSGNELNGTLDAEVFTGFAKFLELDFSYNHVEGPLPSEISKQTHLGLLVMSGNKFTGILPEGLGECTGLQYLFMDRNSYQGDIPSSYCSLASLQGINFSHNNLSGPIPTCFSKFPLTYLDLSYNNFQGSVPTNSVYANASEIFLVGNSRLCGGIPELHLPKCVEIENMQRNKRTVPHALKLIIPVISAIAGVLAIVTGIYLACIRKKKTPLSLGSVMGETFTKVSYDMLLKATSGFSSENLLGSGSFGSVFKGILDGKTVAVKVLNLQHRAASKSFMAECKSLRNIRHRNLVGIITACSSIDYSRNDFRALIYEFMPNGSLDRWLNGILGNMSLSQRVSVGIDVAHALNYLHHECETPIVHRDLKPSNILLDQDMVAHVGDFGLAKFLTQPQHPNQSSTIGIGGTIGYAAPEYGQGSQASTAGDVYSYGILLLELMTGKKPTDSIFKEDYNLHMYAKTAIPDQVLQIADPTLEEDILTEEADDRRAIQDTLQRRKECIISVVSVGVSCSNLLPQDRMKITDAISMLLSSRDNLLNARNRRNHPARGIS